MVNKTKDQLRAEYEEAEARLAEFTPAGAEVLVDADSDQSTANVPLADLREAIADRDAKLAAYESAPD